MRKRYLLAPGPTPVPEEVLLDMARPILHHRSPHFTPILNEVRENLQYLFQTKNDVIFFASSGTGAMEASVANLLSKGDKAICVRGGKFGERWAEICEAYGVEPINIDVEWGTAGDPSRIEEALSKDPSIKAVFTQASETSTAVRYPIKEIAEIVSRYENTVMVVDGITGIGVFDVPVDEWKLDVVVTGSQKALMLPPGLAFVSVSEKAWRLNEGSDLPKYYFSFAKERKALKKNDTAYTPAVSLLIGLRRSLAMIREDGLEVIFTRHEQMAKATREAMKAIGLELFAPDSPSPALTAIKAPEGIDGQKIVKILREKHGITIAGGQSQLKGKIFRIAHMGFIERFDLILTLSAVELTLKELGYAVELGKGVKVAQELLPE